MIGFRLTMGRGDAALKWTCSAMVVVAGIMSVVAMPGLRARIVPGPRSAAAALSSSFPASAERTRGGLATSAGTAFSVGPGLLVTNAHVTLPCIAGRLPIRVAGHRGEWGVVREDKTLDLVLLQGPEQPTIPPLALSATPHVQRDTRSLVLGYLANEQASRPAAPYGALGVVQRATIIVHRPETGQADSFRATDGTGQPIDPTWRDGLAFFGNARSQRMRWALEIAVTMGHGASGGPVLDIAGHVIAVVVADGTGEGLTSAITLADLTDFLAAAGVVPRFAAPANPGGADWNRAYRRAAPSVVRIGC